MPGPLSAVMDPQFRRDVGAGLVNTAGRGIASFMGSPADMGYYLGLADKNPKYGTEWFGQQLVDAGLIGPERNEWAEGLASLLAPAATPNVGLKALGWGSKKGYDLSRLVELLRKSQGV